MNILLVSPCREFKVRDELHRLGLRAYVPVEFQTSRFGKGKETVRRQPVVRGYVFAAVDGPMFARCDGQPSSYETYSCGVIEYRHLDTATSVDVPSRHAERGVTIGVLNGSAYAARGASPSRASISRSRVGSSSSSAPAKRTLPVCSAPASA